VAADVAARWLLQPLRCTCCLVGELLTTATSSCQASSLGHGIRRVREQALHRIRSGCGCGVVLTLRAEQSHNAGCACTLVTRMARKCQWDAPQANT
jgi:hypothetical protein